MDRLMEQLCTILRSVIAVGALVGVAFARAVFNSDL
jgi:hypothetical protein